jgi:hypothetical protein
MVTHDEELLSPKMQIFLMNDGKITKNFGKKEIIK